MVLKKLVRNPISLLGLIILIGFVLVAIFAPKLAPPRDPEQPYMIPRYGYSSTPKPPVPEHPFGTTEGQYDIFYGIVWGTRTAFWVGLFVVGVSCAIGIIVGSIAGYYGGKFDEILMRIVDVFMSFPFLIAAVVITTILGRGLDKVMLAMVCFYWMGYARLVRGSILAIKEEEYILAAKACGVKDWQIIMKHVLPNSIFPVLVQASMNIGSVVITASGLSFLGVGYWYTIVYPGLAIVLFVLAWNLVGDAFRDVLDPKMQS